MGDWGTPTGAGDPAGCSLPVRDPAGNSVELADPGIRSLEE